MQKGPHIILEASCMNCSFARSGQYIERSESGYEISCAHPDYPAEAKQKRTSSTTPTECPMLIQAIQNAAANVLRTSRTK